MAFLDIPIYDIPEPTSQDRLSIESEILILVDAAHYQSEEQVLLSKILGAAQKDLDKVQVVSLQTSDSKLIDWQGEPSILILLFGIRPDRLGLQIDGKYYRSLRVGLHTVIRSHGLDELPKNVDAKRALWQALKTYFNL